MSQVSQLDITMALMKLFTAEGHEGSYEEAYRSIRQWIRDANCVLRDSGGLELKLSEDAKGEFDPRTI